MVYNVAFRLLVLHWQRKSGLLRNGTEEEKATEMIFCAIHGHGGRLLTFGRVGKGGGDGGSVPARAA